MLFSTAIGTAMPTNFNRLQTNTREKEKARTPCKSKDSGFLLLFQIGSERVFFGAGGGTRTHTED